MPYNNILVPALTLGRLRKLERSGLAGARIAFALAVVTRRLWDAWETTFWVVGQAALGARLAALCPKKLCIASRSKLEAHYCGGCFGQRWVQGSSRNSPESCRPDIIAGKEGKVIIVDA